MVFEFRGELMADDLPLGSVSDYEPDENRASEKLFQKGWNQAPPDTCCIWIPKLEKHPLRG
ncbi:hypothetical protein [Melghirimyces algeriensis]|uniref:Uncharacterized protein n=1 Tax=Melghirimyces algeriensis TaxID=910412 RepID=A0A521E0J5_9BACL|nr:hypothetical protein [Melghirimyces algeriensis]SMO77489.1 hypothetical protein SAMN06264849_10789 [Melghirimyces algeriensis]